MIRLIFTDCKWDTATIDEGVQITLFDEESRIMAIVPFVGDPLVEMTTELIAKMTREQRDKLSVSVAEIGQKSEEPVAAAAPPGNGKPDPAVPKPNPFLK